MLLQQVCYGYVARMGWHSQAERSRVMEIVFAAFGAGCICGMVGTALAMSLCVVAKRSDDWAERWAMDDDTQDARG